MAKLEGATFGARVRFAREKTKGWSQAQLAGQVDATSNYIARVERNEARPSDKLITRLANALGVARDDLCEPEKAAVADDYPARRPLLEDEEFKNAPKEVRDRVLGWPDAGAEWTTRQWYEAFSSALKLHEQQITDPQRDPSAKPARTRKRS